MAQARTAGQMRIQLLEKAAEDEAFRARLLADPHAAIAEELGVNLPNGVKIRVLEDNAETTNIVLPPRAKLEAAELESVSAAAKWNPSWDSSGDPTDDNDRNTNAPRWWDSNTHDEN